nr:immunoglobulin light chain junction region [Macaca mulatta]
DYYCSSYASSRIFLF